METARQINTDYWKHYYWQVKAVDQSAKTFRTYRQLEFMDKTNGPDRIRCTKQPDQFSNVYELSLIPAKSGFPVVTTPIPEGAKPIYLRRVNSINGMYMQLRFMVGWKLGDVKVMMAVDAETGRVEMILE